MSPSHAYFLTSTLTLDLKICEAGTYLLTDTNSCEMCEQNTYSTGGAHECKACPKSMTAAEGSKSIRDCVYSMCLLSFYFIKTIDLNKS